MKVLEPINILESIEMLVSMNLYWIKVHESNVTIVIYTSDSCFPVLQVPRKGFHVFN